MGFEVFPLVSDFGCIDLITRRSLVQIQPPATTRKPCYGGVSCLLGMTCSRPLIVASSSDGNRSFGLETLSVLLPKFVELS